MNEPRLEKNKQHRTNHIQERQTTMELFQQNVKAALDRLSAIRIVPVLGLDNL